MLSKVKQWHNILMILNFETTYFHFSIYLSNLFYFLMTVFIKFKKIIYLSRVKHTKTVLFGFFGTAK